MSELDELEPMNEKKRIIIADQIVTNLLRLREQHQDKTKRESVTKGVTQLNEEPQPTSLIIYQNKEYDELSITLSVGGDEYGAAYSFDMHHHVYGKDGKKEGMLIRTDQYFDRKQIDKSGEPHFTLYKYVDGNEIEGYVPQADWLLPSFLELAENFVASDEA